MLCAAAVAELETELTVSKLEHTIFAQTRSTRYSHTTRPLPVFPSATVANGGTLATRGRCGMA